MDLKRGIVYLDNARTTRVDPEVARVVLEFMTEKYSIPGGEFGYSMEEEASEALERSRETLARKINANPSEIIFTSGGTESNNLAIKGVAFSNKYKGEKIVTSRIEEKSVLSVFDYLGGKGFKTVKVGVDSSGFIKREEFMETVKGAKLVSIQHANKEIGTIQDLRVIGDICEERGVLFHSDATQSFTKTPINVEEMKVHLLSLTSHLIHGPKGVGALYVKEGLKLEPLLHGDKREFGLRPGTPNLPGIVGFAKAIEISRWEDNKRMEKLRDELIDELLEIPSTKLNGPRGERRLCNNVNVSFKYVEGESILLHANMKGLIINTGSACYSQDLEPSHVILAIGGSFEEAHSSTRLTLSKWTTKDEIIYAAKTLKEIVERLREISPLTREL